MRTRWPKAGGYYNGLLQCQKRRVHVATKAAAQGPNLGCTVTPVSLALYKCIMSIADMKRSQSKQTR